MLLFLYLGCTNNQRSIPFGYLLHLLVWGHQCPVLPVVFTATEFVEQTKGQEIATTVDVQTLLWVLLNMPVSLKMLFFLVKSQTFVLGITLFKCQIIRISKLPDTGLKELCCIFFNIYCWTSAEI